MARTYPSCRRVILLQYEQKFMRLDIKRSPTGITPGLAYSQRAKYNAQFDESYFDCISGPRRIS
ncbi:Protein of unknown function [Pyronema omphalodes CBS 100304]|uniref:Uncharacterized protein n=1 Tax=Pyronema omphalodes (strain CBS 100304) TaxID=1076935 RepID=U4LAS4_PYROM|nr:Protein of unknown function [Pyronema omphalodes CBS 100304]